MLFSALGLQWSDNSGKLKSQEQMMNETIYALANMENGSEKARLASELFGKAGVDMMPMLNNGADGIKQLTERSHELGLVMSDEAVSAGVLLGDTMDDVKSAFGAIGTNLGSSIIPLVQQVAEMIIDNMPAIQGIIGEFAPVLADLFTNIVPPLLELAQTLLPLFFDLIKALLPIFSEIVKNVLPIILDLMKMLLPPITEIIKKLLPLLLKLIEPLLPLLEPILKLLQPFIDLLMMIITPLVDLLDMILPPLIEVISWLIDLALKPLQSAFEFLAKVIGGVVKGAFGGIEAYITTAKKCIYGNH